MKNIYIILLLIVSTAIKAQEYKLFGISNDNKILLKWMSKNISNDRSFDIFRKEANGTWQKLNTTPIIPSVLIKESELNTPKNPYPNDKSYDFYVKNKNTKETTANKQAYSDYNLALAAIFDNQVAKHLGVFYEDTNYTKGKTVSYKLIDSKTQKELSAIQNMIIGELAIAPTNAKIAQVKQDVHLNWSTNEDYIGYNIYKDGKKINENPILSSLENNTYLSSFVDSNVPIGNPTYVIKGITFLNTDSKPSVALKIAIQDVTPPSLVKSFKGERKNNVVTLTWQPATDTDTKGYNVYKSNDKGKNYRKINERLITSTETKYVETLNRNDFGTFLYQLEMIDESNNTNKSMPVSVFVPDHEAPTKPNELKSLSEVGKITLSWRENPEKDLLGYRIYRGLMDDDENEMLLINVTPQRETRFVDTFNEKAGTKFIYKVVALDKSFNESEKASLWVQLPDVIAPQSPILREVKYEENQVLIQWDAVLNDAILGYDIYRISDNNEIKINTDLIVSTRFSDHSVRKNTIYEYFIKAVDSSKLVSKASNKVVVATTDNKNNAIRLLLSQDLRSKKVQVQLAGIETTNIQEVKLYRKSGISGFVRIPYQTNSETFIDESTEVGVIYEYYTEVITVDDLKLKSETVTFNNS